MLLLLLFAGQPVAADPILINTVGGGGTLKQTTYNGQSLLTPTGPGWTNIEFAFLNGLTPVTNGNLYLLTREYLGAPSGLSATTPGHLATSTGIVGGFWTFEASVFLSPSTTYWFYADALFTPGSITGGSDWPGGNQYVNWTVPGVPARFDDPFSRHPDEDAHFQLNGTPSPVPEPTSVLLLATGVAGAVAVRRWRQR
jgi:hypothetical protein